MSDVILAFASVLMACGLICVFMASSLLLGFDKSHIKQRVSSHVLFFGLKKMHPIWGVGKDASYLGC